MVETPTHLATQFDAHLKQNVADGLWADYVAAGEAEHINEALARTQRLAGIGLLTASVAHEMNTPLSIIAATCSNLQHEIEENHLSMDQLLKYVEMIEQNAWRAARIVEVLRNYSYDEEPQTAVTDLNMIIEDALALVRHQFYGEYNIEIDLDLNQNLGTIVCDHNRMTQVIVNLLINGRDALMPNGGTIRVRSWAEPPPTLMLSRVNGGLAEKSSREEYGFSISDSGHGLDLAVIDKIFDPFFTTKPHGKGTGLGLFVAKRIVEQHNGRITAKNNPDGGATFTVILPRK
jgi:signal transduction histidine kinase